MLAWLVPAMGQALPEGDLNLAAASTLHHRLVRRFDFEERKLGNFEDLPMHWYVMGRPPDTSDPTFLRKPLHEQLVHRPGYPTYTSAGFDQDRPAQGQFSFRLGLNGGNVGAFLEVGTIPAVPGSDYLLTAQVRTSSLRHARAFIHAYFLDVHGQAIETSRVSSQPIRTDGHWSNITLILAGNHPGAAWIGLEVELLQPEARQTHAPAAHELRYQDIEGSAWFDNIALWQVPRVMVQTQSPYNLLRGPDKPRITANVQDLTGQALLAVLTLRDAHGRQIDRISQRVGEGAPMNVAWEPPIQRFGWYSAELTLIDQVSPPHAVSSTAAMTVAQDLCDFLWLPAQRGLLPEDALRFLLDTSGHPPSDPMILPRMLEITGMGGALFSGFPPAMPRSGLQARQAWLDALLEQMLLHGKQSIVSLAPLPQDLAAAVDSHGHGLVSWMANEQTAWQTLIGPILVHQGQFVHAWQLGDLHSPQAYRIPRLDQALQVLQREFRRITPQPRLLIPWRLDQARRPDAGPDTLFHLLIPAAVSAAELPALLAEWREAPASRFMLQLDSPPLPRNQWGDLMDELARRAIESWIADPLALTVPRPWEETVVAHRKRLSLQPALGVLAGLAPSLSGRRLAGELSLGPGIRCLVLDGPGGGAMALWRQQDASDQVLDLFLGGKPESVDLWGNRDPVPLINGRHELRVTGSPQIIEGIDASLALFRAAFRVAPAFLESTQAPHQATLTIVNPWPRVLTGTILFAQPQNWRIEPRRVQFTLSPQQSANFPLEIQLPVSETAGPKTLWAKVELTPDQQYLLDLAAPIEVGMRGIKFDASLTMERNPRSGELEVVVRQTIVNTGPEPVSLYCFASLPGQPRQERLVTGLEPGKPAVRRFRFSNAGPLLEQNPLRTGVREVGGPAILNKILRLEDLQRGQ